MISGRHIPYEVDRYSSFPSDTYPEGKGILITIEAQARRLHNYDNEAWLDFLILQLLGDQIDIF